VLIQETRNVACVNPHNYVSFSMYCILTPFFHLEKHKSKIYKYFFKFVGQLPNVINSHVPSIHVTLWWRLLAEGTGEVSMVLWERDV